MYIAWNTYTTKKINNIRRWLGLSEGKTEGPQVQGRDTDRSSTCHLYTHFCNSNYTR